MKMYQKALSMILLLCMILQSVMVFSVSANNEEPEAAPATAPVTDAAAGTKYYNMSFDDTGWDIYNPESITSGMGYRYGASMIRNGNSIDAWFSCKGDGQGSKTGILDFISYKHSDDGGKTWGNEKIVICPTDLSPDCKSCCDPGVIYFGGYYYVGYTSTVDYAGYENSVFVARSKNPDGPYEKWNGTGWGGTPAPLIACNGQSGGWGMAEPSFVKVGNKLYIYYSECCFAGLKNYIRCSVADAESENWPATIGYSNAAVTLAYGSSKQSGFDVKYDEATGKFIGLQIRDGLTATSYLSVFTSDDGRTFTETDRVYTNLIKYAQNNGVTGDAQGHFNSKTEKMYVSYAYGSVRGRWATRMVPVTLTMIDSIVFDDSVDNLVTKSVSASTLSRYNIGITTRPHRYIKTVGSSFTVTPYVYKDNISASAISDTSNVKLTPLNPSIVSFDGMKGTALKKGTTVVQMEYNGFYSEFTVKVYPAGTDLTSGKIASIEPLFYIGQTGSGTLTLYMDADDNCGVRSIMQSYSGLYGEANNNPVTTTKVFDSANYTVNYAVGDVAAIADQYGQIYPLKVGSSVGAVNCTYNGTVSDTMYFIVDVVASKNPIGVPTSLDGGTLSEPIKVVQGFKYGPLPTPTRAGFKFTGWTLSDGTKITSSTQVTATNHSMLIANWEKDTSTNTITFDANGGSLSGTTTFAIKKGQKYSDVLSTLKTPTRTGQDFTGWYNEKYGFTLDMGATFNYEEDLIFKAQWTPKTYEITYDANGGENAPATEYKTYGVIYYLTTEQPTREGYNFLGWAKTATASLASYAPGAKYTTNAKTTFYAVWEAHTHNYVLSATVKAGCTVDGYNEYTCSCGDSYRETLKAPGHSYGEWVVVTQPTATSTGLKTKTCSVCQDVQSEIIPALEEGLKVYSENYSIAIENATNPYVIRIAKGVYSTAGEIKRADGVINYDSKTIAGFTYDAVIKIPCPEEGTYSFWIRCDQGEFVYQCTLNNFKYAVSVNGLDVKLDNINSSVATVVFAKGNLSTYRECKNNAMFTTGSARLKDLHSFSYTVASKDIGDDGVLDITVLVRDSDNKDTFLHSKIEVNVPSITTDGLNITVDGLSGVKCIKRVFGTFSTVAEVKAQPSVVTYGSNVAQGADSAVLHIPHEGALTVSIQYKNGYAKIINLDIVQKRPTFVQDGNTVTLGNLDDLYVVRYAKGTYAKPNAVKLAPGSKVLRSSAISDGKIVITDLEEGDWTVIVQYNEESINVFNFTVEEETHELASVKVSYSEAFTDDMILQRDEPLSVWGWADAADEGKEVQVNFKGETAYGKIENGSWKATFKKTFAYDTNKNNLEIVDATGTQTVKNVLVGDVYYVIGQSNVHYCMTELVYDLGKKGVSDELTVDYDDNDNIRFLRSSSVYNMTLTGAFMQGTALEFTHLLGNTSPASISTAGKPNWQTPSEIAGDIVANWNRVATERTFAANNTFSALGYLFAYNMAQKTEVPIGVIEIDASGCALNTFSPNELCDKWGDEVYDPATGTYSYALKDKNGNVIASNTALKSRFAYNQQLYPMINFSCAGVIWYQGESDMMNAAANYAPGEYKEETFAHQFTDLMNYFRSHFGNSDFPVYVIEFPSCFSGGNNAYLPTGGVRTEVGIIPSLLDNSYVVSSTEFFWDIYDKAWSNNIHPYIKHMQAERLTNIVLATNDDYGVDPSVYDINIVGSPTFKSATYNNNIVDIKFNYVGSTLTFAFDNMKGFDIYVNGAWTAVTDNIAITSPDTITITADSEILGVRYNYKTDSVFGDDEGLMSYVEDAPIPAAAFISIKN